MRTKLILLAVILILILSSCSSSKKVSKENIDKNISEQIMETRGVNPDTPQETPAIAELESVVGPAKKRLEDIKAQYPEKTILTVFGIVPSDYITDKLNEYLIHNGTDYVIYFKEPTLADLILSDHNIDKEQAEEKKQLIYEFLNTVDIMAMDRDYFYEMAGEGYLETWKDYFNTEEGKSLYQVLPDNNWKSFFVEGQIYGINGRSDLVYGPPSYTVNRALMEKYNISEEDLNKPIYELEEIITKVAEGEKDNPNLKAITVASLDGINLNGISPTYLGSLAIALYNDPQKEAGIKMEDPEYLRWLESLNWYANHGLTGKESKYLENFFIKINVSSSLPYSNPDFGYYYNKDRELADTEDVIEIVLDQYYEGSISWNNYGSYGNCIPAASKHKEEAFDFLNRVYSDDYITNLLLYGIENRNYTMEDGKVEWPIIYVNDSAIGNSYLSYPRYYEYLDKKERYLEIQVRLPYVYYDFVFDPTNVTKEIRDTNQVMSQLSKIISGGVTDFDAFIEDLNKQLKEKGIRKLKDEVDRQKEEWLVRHAVE